jgi:hypothetical protein
MHIIMGDFRLVMPVDIFMLGCQRGTDAVVRWQKKHRDADIIPMRAGH